MKETFKNNIRVTAVTVILILAIIFCYIYSVFYGSPLDKIKVKKEIDNYIESNYSVSYSILDIKYNIDTSNYNVDVLLDDDKKTEIKLSYNLKENIIIDESI